MSDRESLMGAAAAASLLGVSRTHLWKLSREGIVPAVRLGRSYRYAPGALREFIMSGGRATARTAEVVDSDLQAVEGN